MAKLLSYYNLCSNIDQKEFLGLSLDADSGSVINTIGRNLFYTIQLSNQQQIHSWSVLDKLSNRVVYNFKTQKYVGVFSNRYIRCWDADEKDVNTIKKIKLSKIVVDLISLENQDVILVFNDGSCQALTDTLQPGNSSETKSIKPIVDSQTQKMFNVSTFTTINDELFLTYFVKSDSDDVELIYFKLDPKLLTLNGPVNKLKLERREQAKLVGYTVVESDTVSNLLTIWSDQRIFMLPLRESNAQTHDVPGHFVSMLNVLKADQPLTIASISKDCVAIYGANKSQDGASLILYNTKFSVVQSKQFFKVYFQESRLWIIKKHILLAFGQNLACVSFSISKKQLSNMIGSQRDSIVSNVVEKSFINEDIHLEEMLSFDGIVSINSSNLVNGTKSPKLRKSKVLSNVRKHNQAFESIEKCDRNLKAMYSHHLPFEIVRDPNLPTNSVQIKVCSNIKDRMFNIDEIQMLVTELERNGASEYEISEIVIPILIKGKLSNELVNCLRAYTNTSEQRLVDALKYFIILSNENESNFDALNVVLSCTFNEDAIKEHLRSTLSFDEAIFILNHLYGLLENTKTSLDESAQYGDEYDEDMKLLIWFLTIIDANYQQFVLSKNTELPQMIIKWRSLIESHLSTIRDGLTLTSSLHKLIQGKTDVPGTRTSKWYSIEEVKLY